MKKLFSHLIDPILQPYFLSLLLFTVLTALRQPGLAVFELLVCLVLYLYHRRQAHSYRRNLNKYIETIHAEGANPLLSIPFPAAVFHSDTGEIIWTNEPFGRLMDENGAFPDATIFSLFPDFKPSITADPSVSQLVRWNDAVYQLYCTVRSSGGKNPPIMTAYLIDCTQHQQLIANFEATRPVVCVLMLDNYEEMMKSGGEAAKSSVLAQLDERLNEWAKATGGLLCKYDRDRYLLICDNNSFEWMVADKFSVLESVHQVVSEDEVTATLSIGIGKDYASYNEAYTAAIKSIEMALGRGGDQAVVKNSLDFQFYGGRSKSNKKRTKVKSRVMAEALSDLISDATQVYVMGHTYIDMDALGSAAGICCIARSKGKKPQIVLDTENCNANPMLKKLIALPEYANCFVPAQDAFIRMQPGALLVVVDTCRPDMVESRQLLDTCNRVAVIDHHRRSSSFIESAALNFHEPYASSTAELVTELLQYLVEPSNILRTEADCLLAGIVLDTKNFTMRTGGRTFEAAAFLRRMGADTTEVKRYFQNDLPSMIQRYAIIRNAEMFDNEIAIARADNSVTRITAAQAADDLLTIRGVQASFVLYRMNDGIGLSGRSLGEVNVQLILEQLGGGGNTTTAGGFIPGGSMDEVADRLKETITQYRAEIG